MLFFKKKQDIWRHGENLSTLWISWWHSFRDLVYCPRSTSFAIPAASSHPPLGAHVCQPNKHSLSLISLPIRRAALPLDSDLQSSQPVSSSLPVVPGCRFHFGLSAGNNGAGRERERGGERCLVIRIDRPWRRRSWCDGGDTRMDGTVTNTLQVSNAEMSEVSLVLQAMTPGWVQAKTLLPTHPSSRSTSFKSGPTQNSCEWFKFLWTI